MYATLQPSKESKYSVDVCLRPKRLSLFFFKKVRDDFELNKWIECSKTISNIKKTRIKAKMFSFSISGNVFFSPDLLHNLFDQKTKVESLNQSCQIPGKIRIFVSKRYNLVEITCTINCTQIGNFSDLIANNSNFSSDPKQETILSSLEFFSFQKFLQ